ncbi:tetratricopeptide repeat protein [Flavobacteriales bacterium]|nr:tetratricopeptide repeat protein [Flavobacteriales bacterium]
MNDALDTIVQSLSKEEVRFFKLFLKRTDNKNRKDVDLFDYMKRKKGDFTTKDILKKLETNPNNYYQIKNRLYHELNNSMVWQYIWRDKQSKSFSFVLLSRVYKNKGELELSYHYLKKAEKEAIDSELFEVLSIIYSEIIQLSHELISIDVDHYIELKRNNIKILSEIDEMDLLLAKIMYDIKTKQNFGKSDGSLVKLIKTKYGKISKENNLVNSPRFRIRLFKMYSRLLLQERDYQSLEKFLIESYNEFGTDKLFNRSNHNEKLTLLTYLSNCLYKTKKYKQSLKYSEELLSGMKEYDCFLHDKYLFYYYNILVLNYAKTDKEKALDYLNKASRSEVIKKLPSYNAFIYLNRSLIYYYDDNYKESQKNIARLIMQEDFLLLDKSFQLKILVTELMIRMMLSNKNLNDKITSIKKGYDTLLLEENHIREKKMIDLIFKMIHNDDIEVEKKDLLSIMSDSESEDIDIISYNIWIKENIK